MENIKPARAAVAEEDENDFHGFMLSREQIATGSSVNREVHVYVASKFNSSLVFRHDALRRCRVPAKCMHTTAGRSVLGASI